VRNLAKDPDSFPRKPLPPIDPPTPQQSLGWRRGILAGHMINAGVFNSKARILLMEMDAENVERQIANYEKKAA
jgi:hypothetical protein